MGNGEIARYEQFLLFPQCFQDLHYRHVKNQGLSGTGLTLYETFRPVQIESISRRYFKCESKIERVENIVVNRKNGGYQHFLLPPPNDFKGPLPKGR